LNHASLTAIPAQLGPFAVSALCHQEVGCDWYDAFQTPDGRLAVSIGGVMGKGLNASAIMSKVRHTLRAAAQMQTAPGAVLDAADRVLREEYPQAMVTAFFAVLDGLCGSIAYANAGHPRPLVRLPDRSVTELSGRGLPLGLRMREESPQAHIAELVPGSLMVLYTDGLTATTHEYALGEQGLRDAIEHLAIELAAEPAAELAATVLGRVRGDDVAIMTLLAGPYLQPDLHRSFDASNRFAAYEARGAICAELAARKIYGEDILTFELLFSELLGNVLRYAGNSTQVGLNWEIGAPVLHVLDEGPGLHYVPRLPSDVLAESGRGLFLVTALAKHFSIMRRVGGGSHARAVLRARPARA
jgi:anti-sigma regulatory factor (Ser/Thr protein kinase)